MYSLPGSATVSAASQPAVRLSASEMPAATAPRLPLLAALLGLVTTPTASPSPASGRPSLLLLMADDMGAGDPGYAGSRAKTPHLDAWSRSDGTIKLRRQYAMNVCSPSRGAFLTGRHSNRLCIWTADTNALPRAEFTIAEAAREAGMATFHSGKWHIGAMSARVQNSALAGCNATKAVRLCKEMGDCEKLNTYWPKDCPECAPGTSCRVSGPAENGFDAFFTAQPPAFHINSNCGCCGGLNRTSGCGQSPNMTADPPGFTPFPQTNATCPYHNAQDATRLSNVSEYGLQYPAFGKCSTYYFPVERSSESPDGIGAPEYSTVGHDADLQVDAFEAFLQQQRQPGNDSKPFLAVMWFHSVRTGRTRRRAHTVPSFLSACQPALA